MANLNSVLAKFYNEYTGHTSKKLKIIDAYLLYVLLTGIIQFVYCCLVGTFPFNSFLSGFISTVSCFVLGGIELDNFHMLVVISNLTALLVFVVIVGMLTSPCFTLSSFVPFSVSQTSGQSRKQESVLQRESGESICRLHFCPCYPAPGCYEFHWLIPR